jgi:hypothetical protein
MPDSVMMDIISDPLHWLNDFVVARLLSIQSFVHRPKYAKSQQQSESLVAPKDENDLVTFALAGIFSGIPDLMDILADRTHSCSLHDGMQPNADAATEI